MRVIFAILAAGLLPEAASAQRPATTPPAQPPPAGQAGLVAAAGSDTVQFAGDRFDLDQPTRATLAAQARWLNANPTVRASIEGHADERGTREYRLALGERRAEAVRNFLIALGVAANRLSTISWGKERPLGTGSDEGSLARDRRVVTLVR